MLQKTEASTYLTGTDNRLKFYSYSMCESYTGVRLIYMPICYGTNLLRLMDAYYNLTLTAFANGEALRYFYVFTSPHV